MRVHELKIESEYFNAIASDLKTFEIRKNDRDYKPGDVVRFNPIYKDGTPVPSHPFLTGFRIYVIITYVTVYEQKKGFCVFSFQKLEESE